MATNSRRSTHFWCANRQTQLRYVVAEPLTVKHVYELLGKYLNQRRPDVGACKGLLDCVLESSSPFDLKSVRSPKRWFVLSVLLATSALGLFVYFNRFW